MVLQNNQKMSPCDRKEAAKRLGVSLVTIDRELARKRLPHFRCGRRVLFTNELLERYIEQNTQNLRSITCNSINEVAEEGE